MAIIDLSFLMFAVMNAIEIPVCIVGAGPAGATASLYLSRYQIRHVLIDKARFPRDKTCGDGLTIEVMYTLKDIAPRLLKRLQTESELFLPSWGAKVFSPKGQHSRLGFSPAMLPYSPLYTSKRSVFDQALIEETRSEFCVPFLGAAVQSMKRENGQVTLLLDRKGEQTMVKTPLVLGADGERSIVERFLSQRFIKVPEHTYVSVRAYFEGLSFDESNDLEFHFFSNTLPGYFWIFPLPNGEANVGIILLANQVREQKINLRKLFFETIENSPSLKQRFAHAKQPTALKGWGLPLSSHRKQLSGENFVLLGDAAALIEPLSGKGIGISMISGKLAAQAAQKAIENQRFGAGFLNQHYHERVGSYFESEWNILQKLQKRFHSETFVNSAVALHGIPPIQWAVNMGVGRWLKKWM